MLRVLSDQHSDRTTTIDAAGIVPDLHQARTEVLDQRRHRDVHDRGVDHDHDRARGFFVSPTGITVVPKNMVVNEG